MKKHLTHISKLFSAAIIITMTLSGCGAYDHARTEVKDFDLSAVKLHQTREALHDALGEPGKTYLDENGQTVDEWLLEKQNHPDYPPIYNAINVAGAGLPAVVEKPHQTGVNRHTLKLVKIIYSENLVSEAFIEDVCYWGCK